MNNPTLTVDQIVAEASQWPAEKVGELVSRLTAEMHSCDPATEAAWKREIDRRIDEIQRGVVQGIPGEEVTARMRRSLGL